MALNAEDQAAVDVAKQPEVQADVKVEPVVAASPRQVVIEVSATQIQIVKNELASTFELAAVLGALINNLK